MVAENARDVRVDAEKKVRLLEMVLSLLKHKKELFDGDMTAAYKELSTARDECASLSWNREEVLSKLKTLETDLEESLKICPNKLLRVL